MILTDYYKMEQLPNQKSKTRFDCVTSTQSYEPFEAIATRVKEGRFRFYYVDTPDHFRADPRRKAKKAFTDGRDNISQVYVKDLEHPTMAYGNVNHTQDALLFLFAEDYKSVEVFVARGLKNNDSSLFNLFLDGELDEEIERFRELTKPIPDEG